MFSMRWSLGLALLLACAALPLRHASSSVETQHVEPVSSPPLSPSMRLLQYGQGTFRGVMHSVRDLLFPEFRSEQVAAESKGQFDLGFEGESEEQLAWRLHVRDVVAAQMDSVGLPELYFHYPAGTRYGLAAAMGISLLGVVLLMQCLANVMVRGCMQCLFTLTKSDTFLDEPEGSAGGSANNKGYTSMNGVDNIFSRALRDPETRGSTALPFQLNKQQYAEETSASATTSGSSQSKSSSSKKNKSGKGPADKKKD